jgi:hypothetical protein
MILFIELKFPTHAIFSMWCDGCAATSLSIR